MAPPASTPRARKSSGATVAGEAENNLGSKASSAELNKVPAPKKARVHPPYFEMIKEAIMALKERTGSSQYAIAKFIEEKQKDLPSNFKKLLLVKLKKFVASGKLTKVKNSFKLSGTAKASSAPSEKPKVAAKAKKEPAKKVTAGNGGPKPIAATSGKPKKAAVAKKEPAKKKVTAGNGASKPIAGTSGKPKKEPAKKKITGKGGDERGKKRKAVATAPKAKKTPVKKPKSIKSPAKKLKK